METQQTLSFDESVRQVMKSLPPVIRDYITGEKYTPVARSLMTKYGLRIDQGGVLEREIMLLLMGVENPTEFTQSLAEEAKLSKQIIDGIVQDVNDQIFVPLRKEEEKGVVVEPQKTVLEPTSHFILQNKIPVPQPAAPASMSKKDWSNLPPAPMKGTLPPREFLPRASTLGDVVRSVLSAPKSLDNNKLLEDHAEPHIELNKADIPVNLPGAMPEQAIPEVLIPEVRPAPIFKVEPRIQPTAPIAPVASKPIAVAPITSYSSDPYREPIDEPPTE